MTEFDESGIFGPSRTEGLRARGEELVATMQGQVDAIARQYNEVRSIELVPRITDSLKQLVVMVVEKGDNDEAPLEKGTLTLNRNLEFGDGDQTFTRQLEKVLTGAKYTKIQSV